MSKNYLYDARRMARKTQKQMAEHLKMNQSTYSSKESRLDFSRHEWINIESYLGKENIDRAMGLSLVSEEGNTNYDNKYSSLLYEVNRLIELQKLGLIVQAEIISKIEGKSYEDALVELKKLYFERTGKRIDI